MTVNFYKSTSEILIFNFDAILNKDNYYWMVVGYNGYNEKEFEFDIEEAKELWNKIYNEYCKKSNDVTTLYYYEVLDQLGYLKVRKYFVGVLLDQLSTFKREQEEIDLFIDALSKWRFFIDNKKPLELELKRMYRQLRASENRIGLKESELEGLKEDQQEPMSLTTQAVKLALGLGKDKIDTKTITVDEWLALSDELKIINEYKNKKRVA